MSESANRYRGGSAVKIFHIAAAEATVHSYDLLQRQFQALKTKVG